MDEIFSLKSRHYYYAETHLNTFGNFPCRTDCGVVFLCTSGEAVINIGLVECRITKDVETVILPGTTFTIIESSEDFLAKAFTFSKEIYDYTVLRLGISFSRYLINAPSYLLSNNSDFLKNAKLCMETAALIHKEKDNDFVLLLQRNFVQNYFLYLYDKCKYQGRFEHPENQGTRKQRQFYTFLSLLDSHIVEERSVTFYAEKLCITPRYLRKITERTTTGESPKELIDKRLVLEIKVRLQNLDISIQEIADELNFPDQSYLSRYFKLHTGISPSMYRNQIKS
ncbi:MAG: helix-turn-helix domain-containing protein [Tannerellaceae bacterium]|jgi:AraC-like DNA-binding protein|nr:helix-turn-helix domain-containing protein [Tannerellaceae bacterium]